MASTPTIERVVALHRHRVYTLACYTLGSTQDAEDVTQEVLVRYWRHADRVDPSRVEGWLVRVTSNACRDLLRSRSRKREVVGGEACDQALGATPSAEAGPSAPLESAESAKQVEAILARLNEPYRSVVILREVQGLSYAAIAEALEMPLSSVRVTLHRGRRKLADMARQREEPDSPPTKPANGRPRSRES